MRRSMIAFLIMMAAAAGGARADNQPLGFVLSFEGIPFGNPVGDYYNGGGGPNYGVGFSPDFLVVAGGLPQDPSPNAAVVVSGGNGIINVPGGLPAAFSFYYVGGGGEVSVYSDLNGAGSLLGSFDINTPYGDFAPAGTLLTGTAESVVFSNIDASVTIDNMGFGGLVIPEPASTLLFITGLVGIAAWRRRIQGPANGSSE